MRSKRLLHAATAVWGPWSAGVVQFLTVLFSQVQRFPGELLCGGCLMVGDAAEEPVFHDDDASPLGHCEVLVALLVQPGPVAAKPSLPRLCRVGEVGPIDALSPAHRGRAWGWYGWHEWAPG